MDESLYIDELSCFYFLTELHIRYIFVIYSGEVAVEMLIDALHLQEDGNEVVS